MSTNRIRNVRLAMAAMGLGLIAATATPALAQKSLADIQAEVAAGSSDLAQVDAMLADPDPNKRIAAMVALLGSGNPVFIQRAKEAGLLSSDVAMQTTALKATLDAGGPLQIDLSLAGLESKALSGWQERIVSYGTLGADGKTASYTVNVAGYDPENKCHKVLNDGSCMLWLDGTVLTISLPASVKATVRLDTSGAMSGSASSEYESGALAAVVNFLD